MKITVFFCLVIVGLANSESSGDDVNMNMLHARRLAASSLRSTMAKDKCLPYALCLLGTMDIKVKEHKQQFPTWAHGLFETVLPLLEKFNELKGYMHNLATKTKEKVGHLVGNTKDGIHSFVDSAGDLFNQEDKEDDKTFRHLLASYKVGRKMSSRGFCMKLFSCPSHVAEDLNRSDEETQEEVVAESSEGSTGRGRLLSVGCPPVGAKFCGAFWLACNFNGLVGAGIPGNACNFLAIFCNAPAYVCREAPSTTEAITTQAPHPDLPK
jgi:hypothetical protein